AQDGSGTWSNGGANWRNTDTSTDNQNFANGDSVRIGAGASSAGTITVSGTVITPNINFATTGVGTYTVTGGTISMTNGTITQNVNATISSILAGSNITKNGAATLTLGGSSSNTFTGSFSVNAGTVVLNKAPNSDSQLPQAIASNVTVNIGIDTSSAIVQLGRSHQIADTGTVLNFTGTELLGAYTFRMNGFNETVGTIKSAGGIGVIENNHASNASTLTVNNATNDTFSGIIRNAASTGAVLNFTKANTGTLTLTGENRWGGNSFTGTTTVRGGTLEVIGSGALYGTTNVILSTSGTLRAVSTSSMSAGAGVNPAATLTLRGGTLEMTNDGTPFSGTDGTVGATTVAAGASTIALTTLSPNDSTLTLSSLSRNKGATVNFVKPASIDRIVIHSGTAATVVQDHGLIGNWATVGNEFAKYQYFSGNVSSSSDPGVRALEAADYVTSGEADWTFESNAKITGSTTLADDRRVNSLNIAAAGVTTVNLNGESLRVESGGLLVSGTSAVTISNGALTAGTGPGSAGELIIHQNSSALLDITATIVNNSPHRVALVKSGTGTARLSAANSFTGGVYVNAGTLQINNAAAIHAANTLAVEGGTLDLNGNDLTVASLSSQDSNTTGLITNTNAAGGAKTLTAGGDNSSTSFSGQFGANLNFTKTGTGTLALNQSNAAYAGVITVAQGTLATGGATSLGAATGTTDRTIVQAGATLDISNGINRNERLEVAGHGVNGLGAVVANSGDSQNIQNMTLTGHTTLGVNVRYDFDNTLAGGGFNLTKIGSGELALEGASVQNLGDVHLKQGVTTWSGSADLGVSTNTLYVDAAATAQFYNKNNDTKQITLAGGQLRRAGTSTGSVNQKIDVLNGLKLEVGASSIGHSNSQLVFQLNEIRRDIGAALNVDNNATLATTDTRNDAGGILGGYLTVGRTDWAKNATNGDDGAIVAYTGYALNDFTAATNNVDVTGTQSAANATVHTLRFATGPATLNLTGTNTVTSGGILISAPQLGGGPVAISGGTLRGAAGGDLVVLMYGGATATISSNIIDNTSATALTVVGMNGSFGPTLTLTGNNTYTGGTFILGGNVTVNAIADTGFSNLGNSAGGTDNAITFQNDTVQNGGTLKLASTGTDSVTGRNLILLGNGKLDVGTGRRLELSGSVLGETLLEGEGAAATNLGISGTGTLVFSGTTSNTYTGTIMRSDGVLELNKSGGATAIAGDVAAAGGGTIRLLQSNQIADTSIMILGTGGTFDLAGKSEVIGGLTNVGGSVKGSSATGESGVLETRVASGATHIFSGTLADGTGGGTLSYTKSGAGTQVFSGLGGANSYTGNTTLTEGTLQLGNGNATGSLATASNVIFNGGRLAITRSDNVTFSNVMSGSGTFAVTGTGSVTIDSGANTHAGTTEVLSGALYVTNATGSATGSTNVLVTGTGRLGGTGRISGPTTVREGGQLTPGTTAGGSIGTLTLGDLTVNRQLAYTTPSIIFQLGSSGSIVYNDAVGISANTGNLSAYFATKINDYESETGEHDRLLLEGTLNLDAGATIALNNDLGYSLKAGDVLDLLDWVSLNLLNAPGDRAWSSQKDLILPTLGNGLVYDLSLFESNGIVVVVAVPEPGRAMLLLLGAIGLVLRRRRRGR
ncbi:MAG: beta strand repeat-containing protein, partial [Roseimicrobium sp.]